MVYGGADGGGDGLLMKIKMKVRIVRRGCE